VALPDNASIAKILDQLVMVEQAIDPRLRVYRWRPANVPEFPALYNWLADSPADWPAIDSIQETLNLAVRVAVRHTDSDEEMALVEDLADRFRETIDQQLNRRGPLGGVQYAQRNGMRNVLDRFGDITALCIEFPVAVRVERIVTPLT